MLTCLAAGTSAADLSFADGDLLAVLSRNLDQSVHCRGTTAPHVSATMTRGMHDTK